MRIATRYARVFNVTRAQLEQVWIEKTECRGVKMPINNLFEQIEPFLRQIIREEVQAVLLEADRSQRSPLVAQRSKSLMSVKGLAKSLGISEGMVHRLRREGGLGFYRVGRRILFSLDEHVRPFLANR